MIWKHSWSEERGRVRAEQREEEEGKEEVE